MSESETAIRVANGRSVTDYETYIHEPTCRQLDHIPGDYGLPVLGHTFTYLKDPLPWAQERYRRYGPVSRVCTTGSRGVLCLGPDLVQRIMLDPGRDFSSRMGFQDRVATFFGGSLIMEDFEHHRFQRRIAQTAFKHESLAHYTADINDLYRRTLDEWAAAAGEVIPFFDYIKALLLRVAEEVFIGEKEADQAVRRLSTAFIDCVQGMMYILPVRFPGTTLHRGLMGRRYLERYVGGLISAKREGEGRDILSHFCRERDEHGNFFSDEDIANQMIFLLFAAHDTTTAALCFTIYYLARNPEVKEQLYREISVFGKAQLDYADLDALPYLQQVFNEVQRIRPSVPVVPRRSIREVEMAGHRIPAHTMVFTLPRFTHWMEEYWTEPRRFDPDRFSPERAEHKQHPFLFHPFGGGAHKCIGMHFAQMEYKCFMYQFLRRFDFEARHKKPDVYVQTWPLPKPSDDMPVVLQRAGAS